MEDLKGLTLSIELDKIHNVMMKYTQRRDFIYSTVCSTFDEAERNEHNTTRIITLSTEIILLQSIFRDYVDEDEYEAKLKSLNDELDAVKELRAKTNSSGDLRKGANENDYERTFNILSQL